MRVRLLRIKNQLGVVMFEKDAEKYRLDLASKLRDKISQGYNCKELSDIELAFQKGAQLGYDKANEWHYIKDGELPKDESRVWLYFGNDDYNDGRFIHNRFCSSSGWFDVDEVVAWQELVPPKDGE